MSAAHRVRTLERSARRSLAVLSLIMASTFTVYFVSASAAPVLPAAVQESLASLPMSFNASQQPGPVLALNAARTRHD